MNRIGVLVASCLLAFVPSALALGSGTQPTTVITKVVPDFTIPIVTIHGQNFGTTPIVTLGDDTGAFFMLTVDPNTVSDSFIEASSTGTSYASTDT